MSVKRPLQDDTCCLLRAVRAGLERKYTTSEVSDTMPHLSTQSCGNRTAQHSRRTPTCTHLYRTCLMSKIVAKLDRKVPVFRMSAGDRCPHPPKQDRFCFCRRQEDPPFCAEGSSSLEEEKHRTQRARRSTEECSQHGAAFPARLVVPPTQHRPPQPRAFC